MKSLPVALARACMSLALVSSFGSAAFAADLAVTGNLSVTGDADISGNTFSFGTRTDSSVTPGLNLLYSDATAPTVYFSATRSGANWLWQSNTSKSQLKLTTANQLQLFDQATTPVAKIILDPLGTSSFAGPVTFAAQVTLQGGLGSVSGSLSASGNLSASGDLTIGGSATIGGNTNITGDLTILDANGGTAVGVGNQIFSGNINGNAFGSNNLVGLLSYGYYSIYGSPVSGNSLQFSGDQMEVFAGYVTTENAAWLDFGVGQSLCVIAHDVYYNGSDTYFSIDGLPEAFQFSDARIYDFNGNESVVNDLGTQQSVVIYGQDATGWILNEQVYAISGDSFVCGVAPQINEVAFDGVNTLVTLDGSYLSTNFTSPVRLSFMKTIMSTGSSAFGNGNRVSSEQGLAFGINNTVGTYYSVNGSAAFGSNNFVAADYAYVFGQGINNYDQGSVQIGTSDSAKLTIDSGGNVTTTGGFSGTFTGYDSIFYGTQLRGTTLIGGTGAAQQVTITSAGNVGIGTNAPTVKLDVVGNTKVTGTLTVSGGSIFTSSVALNGGVSGNLSTTGTISAANLNATSAVSAPSFTATSTTGASSFFGGLIGPGNFNVKSDGKVGIDSTAPTAKLQIEATIGGVDPLILRDKTNNANARFYFTNPIGSPADLNINSGRVIFPGYSILLSRLESPGGLVADFSTSRMVIAPYGGQSVAMGGSGVSFTSPGKLNSVLTATDSSLSAALVLQGYGSSDLQQWRNPSGVLLGKIDGSGNVGIGIFSPAAKLDVNGGINFASGNVVGAANLNISTDTSQAYYYGLSRGSQFAARFNGMRVYNIANASNAPGSRIGFFTDNTYYTPSTEWMTINELGNIGVGTTSPTVKLDVLGDAKISGTLTVGGASVLTNGGTLPASIVQTTTPQTLTNKTLTGTTLSGATVIGGASPSQQVLVDSTGKLGVGTAVPAEKIDVVGNIKTSGILMASGATFTNASGQATTISGNTITGGTAGLTLNAGETNQDIRLTASGTGRVVAFGGTDVGLLASSVGITMNQNGSNGLYFYRDGYIMTSGAFAYGIRFTDGISTGNYTFDWLIGGTSALSIYNNRNVSFPAGNVGIGTIAPAEKLEVSGNIKVSGTVTAGKIRVPASGDLSMGDFTAHSGLPSL